MKNFARIPARLQDLANIITRRKERKVGQKNGTARGEERRQEEVEKKNLQRRKT